MNLELDKSGYERVKMAFNEAAQVQEFAIEEARKYMEGLQKKRKEVLEAVEELNEKVLFGQSMTTDEQKTYQEALQNIQKITMIGMNIQKLMMNYMDGSEG